MTSEYETNPTHINIVRLAEPITRCVRWRTQVFKIEGLVCKRFFLPLSLLSFFGSRFIFRAVKTENLVPLSFFPPKLNGNACYAGYATLLTKGANPLPHAGSLTKIVTFFFRKQGHPKPHPVPEKLRANTTMGKGERLNEWKLNILSTVSCSRNFLPNRYFSRKKKVSQQISPDTDWQKSQE